MAPPSHSEWARRPIAGRPATGRSVLAARRAHSPAGELHAERIAMDFENATGLGEVPAYALEDAQHDLTLELIGRLVQRQRLGRADLRGLVGQGDVERQIVELD